MITRMNYTMRICVRRRASGELGAAIREEDNTNLDLEPLHFECDCLGTAGLGIRAVKINAHRDIQLLELHRIRQPPLRRLELCTQTHVLGLDQMRSNSQVVAAGSGHSAGAGGGGNLQTHRLLASGPLALRRLIVQSGELGIIDGALSCRLTSQCEAKLLERHPSFACVPLTESVAFGIACAQIQHLLAEPSL